MATTTAIPQPTFAERQQAQRKHASTCAAQLIRDLDDALDKIPDDVLRDAFQAQMDSMQRTGDKYPPGPAKLHEQMRLNTIAHFRLLLSTRRSYRAQLAQFADEHPTTMGDHILKALVD